MEEEILEEEESTIDATQVNYLPIEVWSVVFRNLVTAPESILYCREVCVSFKSEVDRNMLECAPPELDPLTKNGIPVQKLWPTKIYNLEAMAEFHKEMKGFGGNPFPTRMLSFQPKRCSCNFANSCSCNPDINGKYYRFYNFSERFGSYVHGLGYTVVNRSSVRQLEGSVFRHFPNLRQLEIKLIKSNTSCSPNEESFHWLDEFTFPPLVHLTDLKLHFYDVGAEVLITELINAYGSQIKTLAVTILETTSSFGKVSPDLLPNLRNLKIRFVAETGQKHVLNFIQNGNWSLKQLTLFERRSTHVHHYTATYQLNDVMDVLSKFASTLEILHLYFSNDSRTMFRLNCLSKPDKMTPQEVANELQLSITLPRVHEFSISYVGVHVLSATCRLTEKFDNLKAIHISDDKLKNANYNMPNYEQQFNAIWWPALSPLSQLERVFIYSGNAFDEDVVVHKVINKPNF